MNTGYVKLHRKVMNSFVWTNPYMYKLWNLCLMKASHENRKILFNGKEIQVNSGEFVTGRDAITSEMNEGVKREHQVNSGSVWRWLKQFEKNGMLNIKSTTKYSVISIKNWSLYQSSEQQMNIKRTTSEQQVHTNKNDKNDKNDKNNNPRNSRKTREYADDDPNKKLAILLLKLIRKNRSLKEPDLNKWANTIRLTIEADKRTGKEVQDMIVWATNHDFWSTVISSPTSLRKNFDTMVGQKNKRKQQNISNDELPETGEDW
ncbi:hypothetical protein GHA87_11855 [Enterococcus faecium]|nr:hypothetical protein [Enterococcus faecium]